MDLEKIEQEIRASRGVAYEYQKQPRNKPQPQSTPVNYLHDLIESDNVMTAAFDATTDVMTMNGYSFTSLDSKDDSQVKEAIEVFDTELDFDEELDNLIYNMLLGDAFLEFLDGQKGDREVHTLESREMYIKATIHGETVKYVQKPNHSEAGSVSWNREEVIHFPIKKIGSGIYSKNPNKSVLNPLRIKKKASNYLESIFDNFPPKLMYILKSANKAQSDQFIGHLRDVKFDPSRDVVTYGEADVKQTGLNLFDKGLMEVLEYVRTEIAMVTRVPKSWLGIRESGGRGTGEIETLAFFSKIKKMMKKIESKINKELLPKLKLDKVKFKFNPISLLDEKTVMEIAERLKNVGIDDDSMLHYLHQKGIQIPNNATIKEPPVMMNGGESEDDSFGNKDKDLMPSRERNNKLNGKRADNLNEQGVSDEGKKKLEERNVRMAGLPDSSKHWEYEGLSA